MTMRPSKSIVNAIQNLNIITRLGFSPLTAMTDVGISSVHLNYQGVPILKSYHHMITETIKGESEEMMTDIFRMLHAGNDGVLSYGMGRFQLGDSQPGALSGMVDSFVHATGLVQLTNRMRTAYVKMTSMHQHWLVTSFSRLLFIFHDTCFTSLLPALGAPPNRGQKLESVQTALHILCRKPQNRLH